MTKTIFKNENLKTIVLVEKVEMLILIISTLLVVTEKFSTKSSSKKVFIQNFFINFISLIIKSVARKFFQVDAEKLK